MTAQAERHTKRERGFSLVETVAALGILALAAVPLMQLSSGALQSTGRLEARFLARTTAENVLSRMSADTEPLEVGEETGTERQMGRDFNWTLIIVPTDRERLFRLEVRVRQAGREQVLARLVTLKAEAAS